ncbi:MAG: glycogen/starch/alpha-glucan phosphorylase, partial [Eubacteriales bacterium]|nr:glycogen/starch/alpha-glucan phosphorylase [Eubacteriales bacterium]
LRQIKKGNKERLAKYIATANGIIVDTDSIFDIQVKRLHEYKRQMLNALHILYLYRKIKFDGWRPQPKTFIFAAKASAGYYMAKEIIRFICALSDMIEKDPVVCSYIKVVFIADYRVSLAEIIIPAADISEQISQAGKEASGTGNMKLMINGAVTCGTMDGANVEIYEAVGDENIFIFGLTTSEVNDLNARRYNPREYYRNNHEIREVLEFIKSGGVNGLNFDSIYNYLMDKDPFMNLADFASYCDIHQDINDAYADKKRFSQMSLKNIANAGIFAADRSVKEYCDNIWHTKQVY